MGPEYTCPMSRRSRTLWIAFLFHVPGLKLLTDEPIPGVVLIPNLLAIAATLAATVGLGLQRWWYGAAAFAVGHFVWGAWLSRRVARSACR
jgi:hypothetical protein